LGIFKNDINCPDVRPLFPTEKICINFDKNGFGYISGDFFHLVTLATSTPVSKVIGPLQRSHPTKRKMAAMVYLIFIKWQVRGHLNGLIDVH
jgi:hypothetical protein